MQEPVAKIVLRNGAKANQLSALDMRFLGVLGVCGIIAQVGGILTGKKCLTFPAGLLAARRS